MDFDFKNAEKVFNDYVATFDMENGKVQLKHEHTFGTVEAAKYIAEELNLNEEDKSLARMIALLHDLGRFEQIARFDAFSDFKTGFDHADYANKLLFEDGMIRQFMKTDKYDRIIEKAVGNHNKFAIENGLTEKELLHAKIIRDADKIDIFRVNTSFDLESTWGITEPEFTKQTITPVVFDTFLNHEIIGWQNTKNMLDAFVNSIAFMFDLNFDVSKKYIKDKNYVNTTLDRFEFKNPDTKEKVQKIRKIANEYLEQNML